MNENMNFNTNNVNANSPKPKKSNGANNFQKFVKENKLIVAIACAVIVIIIVVAVALALMNKSNDTATKTNNNITAITSSGIIKDEEYQGLKFTNATLVKEGDIYTLSMDVTNATDKAITVKQVDIPIKDDKGTTLITLLGYIGDELQPNETRTVTASTSADLSKASTKEIVENK